MIIVSYDFTNNKKRTKFSKFLEQYGKRIQYSVFKIKNSNRVLNNIIAEIELRYKKGFKDCDSVIVYKICEGCQNKISYYGNAKNETEKVVYFS